jgi:ribosomal-protein-alanine N-acetyltransferase
MTLLAPMTPADLPEVLEIESRSYPLPWTDSVFQAELELLHSHCVVAKNGNAPQNILGYAVFWTVPDEGELLNLAVRPEARGLGVGKQLLTHVLEVCHAHGLDAVFLEVRTSNAPAIALYRGAGFEQVALRKRYYRDNDEDALILRYALTRSP